MIQNGTINGTSTGIRAGEPGQNIADPDVTITNVSISGEVNDATHGDIDNVTQSLMTVNLDTTSDDVYIAPPATGQIKITDAGGTDVVTYNGSASAETFNVNAITLDGNAYVGINKEAPAAVASDTNYEVATRNVEDIVINTGNGGDTVIVTGSLNGTGLDVNTITVNGGTGTDTVNVGGLTSAHSVDVNAGTDVGDIVVLGGAFGDWTITFASGAWTATNGSQTHDLVGVEKLQFTGSAGTTHLVDTGAGGSDYASIQAAVNAAASGDTILLSSGTHLGGIDIQNKDITILGSNHGVDPSLWAPGGRVDHRPHRIDQRRPDGRRRQGRRENRGRQLRQPGLLGSDHVLR